MRISNVVDVVMWCRYRICVGWTFLGSVRAGAAGIEPLCLAQPGD